MHEMTIYTANCRQKDTNTIYPNKVRIANLSDLLKAVSKDNLMSAMKNGERGEANFIKADCIYLDLDNTHSENPETWKTLDDISDALPDVEFYYVKSRNYMKVKTKTDKKGNSISYEAREKYHLYFPLKEEISNYTEAKILMYEVCGLFPFFDMGAAKPAQFFYGVEKPEGGQYDGQFTIDEYIKDTSTAALRQQIEANLTEYGENLNNGNYEKGDNVKGFNSLCSHFGIKNPLDNEGDNTPPADLANTEDNWLDAIEQEQSVNYFLKWAQKYNQKIIKRYNINSITHPHAEVFAVNCPWCDEHTSKDGEKDSVVIIDRTAKLKYICLHGHCVGRGWKDYRQKVEAENPKVQEPQEEQEVPEAQEVTAEPTEPKPYNTLSYIETAMGEDMQLFKGEIKTGFKALDEQLGGGLYSGLYTLAALPSLGKTTFALQIGDQIAQAGNDVLIFSLEQSRFELVSKSIARICAEYDIDSAPTSLQIRKGWKGRNGEVAQAVKEYISRVGDRVNIVEGYMECNISYIAECVRQHIRKNRCRPVVIIDYLQLLEQTSKAKNTTKEAVDNVTKELRQLVRKENITIIAISSINRANYLQPIRFESLKESGSIEFSSDCVLGLQLQCLNNDVFKQDKHIKEKEEMLNRAKSANPRQIELRCLKNRYGKGTFSTFFNYYPRNDLFVPEGSGVATSGRRGGDRI